MNQPTREEFEQLKEEVRKLREQITEPMKPINVNVASADVIIRLDRIQQYFSQELKTVSDTWLDTLQEHYTKHTARFKKIEETMATKDDISALRQEMATMKEDIIDAIRKYSQPGKN